MLWLVAAAAGWNAGLSLIRAGMHWLDGAGVLVVMDLFDVMGLCLVVAVLLYAAWVVKRLADINQFLRMSNEAYRVKALEADTVDRRNNCSARSQSDEPHNRAGRHFS